MAAPNVDMPSSPAGQEEAMDVGGTKFEENVWYKKYQLLKRKCSEFEQVDLDHLVTKCVHTNLYQYFGRSFSKL